MNAVLDQYANPARVKHRSSIGHALEHLSTKATGWAGSSSAFALAVLVIGLWLVTGPIFGFSDTWQLVINTTTTIITFLMVFLIQRAQNKDSQAIHVKLDELVASIEGASNRLIDVESLDEEEMATLHRYYGRLVEIAKRDSTLTRSHSIEEAENEGREKP